MRNAYAQKQPFPGNLKNGKSEKIDKIHPERPAKESNFKYSSQYCQYFYELFKMDYCSDAKWKDVHYKSNHPWILVEWLLWKVPKLSRKASMTEPNFRYVVRFRGVIFWNQIQPRRFSNGLSEFLRSTNFQNKHWQLLLEMPANSSIRSDVVLIKLILHLYQQKSICIILMFWLKPEAIA